MGDQMNIIFHYPPELLSLLIETLPRLCKTKADLLSFFQGCGVDPSLLSNYEILHRTNRDAFKKHSVTRELLTQLNAMGERSLRERREVLKRVTEFQDFSVCWESDRASARGLVAQIRELIDVEDAFTRMNIAREYERSQRLDEEKQKAETLRKKRQELDEIKQNIFALFNELNPYKRGKALETVLNRYFKFNDILVSEAITLKGDQGSGIVEQIDGVIQIRGHLYLVEMKWEQETIGREKVASHLVRVFNRGLAGGIFISYSNYSPAVITDCREALINKVIVLCKLDEFVRILEQGANLIDILHAKIDTAIIHKNPFFQFPF